MTALFSLFSLFSFSKHNPGGAQRPPGLCLAARQNPAKILKRGVDIHKRWWYIITCVRYQADCGMHEWWNW